MLERTWYETVGNCGRWLILVSKSLTNKHEKREIPIQKSTILFSTQPQDPYEYIPNRQTDGETHIGERQSEISKRVHSAK